MKQLLIFLLLLAAFMVLLASAIFPHFGLALLGFSILGVLWIIAGNIKANSEEYEWEEGE